MNRYRVWTFPKATYNKRLQTQRTALLSVFVKIFPEADEQSPFGFPEFLMFDTFLKIGYFTFLIPFRFGKNNDGKLKIVTNIFQQIISTFLVLGASIHSLFAIRLLFEMDLKRNPSEAFAIIFGMMNHCFPIAWFYTFWIRRSNFYKLLLVCQSKSSSASMNLARAASTTFVNQSFEDEQFIPRPRHSVDWKLALFCRLAILVASLKIVYETVQSYRTVNTKNESFLWKVLGFNAGAALYNYRIHDKYNDKGTEALAKDWVKNHEYRNLTLMSSSLLFGTVYDCIFNLVDAFCFVGAAITYSVCKRFVHEIPPIKEDEDGITTNPIFLEEQDSQGNKPSRLLKILERMSVDFMELNNVEGAANKIFGPVFLVYVLGAFPSLAGFMIFKQQSSITGERFSWFAIIYSVTMHVTVAMIASEGNAKIGGYKCWLFDISLLRKRRNVWKRNSTVANDIPVPPLSNAVLSRLNHLHREVASDPVGLKGSGFFTMTHGLIGTMLGIFVTFAIVIVQFEMDVAKQQK